jgi:hypothetical protein
MSILFRSESSRTSGTIVRTTITVSRGEIDTSITDELTDVTLVHQGGGTYVLTTRGTTLTDRTVRTTMVYNALLRYYEGNRQPLEQLIEADRRRKA